MDSCHIFNLLFGTRKTTSELRKCFSAAASASNGGQSGQQARSKKSASSPPSSPLRQIQSKLASWANSATSTKLATGSRGEPASSAANNQTARPKGARPQSGTYKATLIELPLDDNQLDEEPASQFKLIKSSELADANNNNNQTETSKTTISNKQCSKRTVLYDNPAAADRGEPRTPERELSKQAEREQKTEQKTGQNTGQETRENERENDNLSEKQLDKNVAGCSERVRHLVRSFESFEESSKEGSRDNCKDETSLLLQETTRLSGRNGTLRLRWPPACSNSNSLESDTEANLEAEEGSQAGQRAKPTTIVKPLPPKTPPKSKRAKCLTLQLSLQKAERIEQLFQDDHFLERHFFVQLRPLDRCSAAQVCRKWRNLLYARPEYWKELVGVIDCTQLRREHLIQCIVSTLQTAKQKQRQQQQQHVSNHIHAHHQSHHNNSHANSQSISNQLQRQPMEAVAQEALECLDQGEIWRIQELCNRYARGSLASSQQFTSRSTTAPTQQDDPMATSGDRLANSKSQSSIRSQMSSTLSSVSLSSLLSPLSESSRVDSIRERLYTALDERGFDALCLFGASDDDIEELVSKTRPQGAQRRVLVGRLNNCALTDKGLELFVSTFNQMVELELSGCNEITNAIELRPLTELKRLIITDCINIADGLAQRLVELFHQLEELVIQAYHLTDAFLEYISLNEDTSRLQRLELPNCKELSNASMLTIAKHFPNVRALSISGSTKISDDGIEILSEHAKQLRSLDLSWCTKITDVSLECLACDLGATLSELVLDRNVHITDIGLGYLATMSRLEALCIRWCPRVTDLGVESVLTMRTLRRLSLAGLQQLTARSLLCLIEAAQGQQLEEVELTNCAAVNSDLMQFLRAKMPKCNIIF